MRDSKAQHGPTLYGVLHEIEGAMFSVQAFDYTLNNHRDKTERQHLDDAIATIDSLGDDLCRILDDLRAIVGESFTQASR